MPEDAANQAVSPGGDMGDGRLSISRHFCFAGVGEMPRARGDAEYRSMSRGRHQRVSASLCLRQRSLMRRDGRATWAGKTISRLEGQDGFSALHATRYSMSDSRPRAIRSCSNTARFSNRSIFYRASPAAISPPAASLGFIFYTNL